MDKAVLKENQRLQDELNIRDMVITKMQEEDKIRREEGKKRRARQGRTRWFTKVFNNNTKELLKSTKFDNVELAILFYLVVYLGYENNEVVDNDGQRLNISDLAKIAGMHRTTISDALARLEEKRVLRRIKDGGKTYIILDAYFFYRGEAPNDWKGYPQLSNCE